MASKKAKDTMKPQEEQMPKTHKSIIHWVRRNVPTKKTKFLHSHVVEYFVGSKAIDGLVNDSPWSKAKAKEGSEPIFDSREKAMAFMDEMLKQKMFHRARKIPVVPGGKKVSKGSGKESEPDATPKPGSKDADKKQKRKIRLDMHLDQIFMDSMDAYVWLYDPIPWYYWAGGTAIVLGIIAVCLFPLWPPTMRKGVHYLSLAAAGFLVFIIALGILKYIVFAAMFALSGGRLKLWIFPNLTEDVGFFESFWPLYDYTFSKSGGKKKKRKAKESDDEDDGDNDNEGEKRNNSDEDDSSKGSSTGKDFEIVDKNDTDQEQ